MDTHSSCPVGIASIAGSLAHPGAVFSHLSSSGACDFALIGVIIRKGANGTVHGVHGAVQIVGMQPLIIFAPSHTGPITIGDGNLFVVVIGAFLNTQLIIGIGE